MKTLNTLYARMVLVLFLLFTIVGGVFLLAALYSAHMYQQEISQRLNHDLAGYIVNEHVLINRGAIQQENLKQLFHKAMIINPSLELYLLDTQGKVLAFSDVLKDVQRDHVSLQPVQKLLSGDYNMPIMGDDPRNLNRQQVFTAAPIIANNALQGYIYAVLGSERVEHITQLIQKSYIMKWSLAAIGIALLFSFVSGLLLFYLLTRKLRKLSHSMQTFSKNNNLFEDIQLNNIKIQGEAKADEIDHMAITFDAMAARIQSQMTRLQETDALRRELVANVSHDLRTPLASLKGYLETLLLKDNEIGDDERQYYLDIAHTHAERLSKLVIELFELAKLDANELKPNKEMFSLAELAHDVSHKFHLRAQANEITLIIETDPDIPFVNADLGMIERVLDNLIDNAFKHTPSGGEIRICLKVINKQVKVSVADTGYGIAEDVLPHIFKRFYRTSESSVQIQTDESPQNKIPQYKTAANSSAQSGAGLGLAIASRIIELHGSELSVSSVLHQGTEFMFSLPANSPEHQFT